MKIQEILEANNTVIHCPEKWMAVELGDYLENISKTWTNAKDFLEVYWQTHQGETCFNIHGNLYGIRYYYISAQYQIIPFLEIGEFAFKKGDMVKVVNDSLDDFGKIGKIISISKTEVNISVLSNKFEFSYVPIDSLERIQSDEFDKTNNSINSIKDLVGQYYVVNGLIKKIEKIFQTNITCYIKVEGSQTIFEYNDDFLVKQVYE